MTKRAQFFSQTGTNVIAVLDDENSAFVLNVLDHQVANSAAERFGRSPSLICNTERSRVALQNISDEQTSDEQSAIRRTLVAVLCTWCFVLGNRLATRRSYSIKPPRAKFEVQRTKFDSRTGCATLSSQSAMAKA